MIPQRPIRKPELTCLCGAREDDIGQPSPRECWLCAKPSMNRANHPTKGVIS